MIAKHLAADVDLSSYLSIYRSRVLGTGKGTRGGGCLREISPVLPGGYFFGGGSHREGRRRIDINLDTDMYVR